MKIAAIVAAVIPLIMLLVLSVLLVTTSNGWDAIGYIVYMLVSAPVLMIISLVSVYLSFKKKSDPAQDVGKIVKAVSILSLLATAVVTSFLFTF